MEKTILIIGNGIAGTTAAFTLRECGFQGTVKIITDESHWVYFRTRIPELISGNGDPASIIVTSPEKHAAQKIEVLFKTHIREITPDQKQLITDDGRKMAFDELILATGSRACLPPIDGIRVPGVFALRTMDDALAIRAWTQGNREAVVVGGGILGLEVAWHFIKMGLKTQVVELCPRLLPRQMDEAAGAVLQRCLEEKGFIFHLGKKVKRFVENGKLTGVEVEGVGELPAAVCVISAGVASCSELLKNIPGACDRGTLIDDSGRVCQTPFYAAGDNVQFGKMLYGTWLAARHWGKCVGQVVAGQKPLGPPPGEVFRLKVSGIDLMTLGCADVENTKAKDGTGQVHVLAGDPKDGKYQKLVFENGVTVGAIVVGSDPNNRFIETSVRDKLPAEQVLGKLRNPGSEKV